MRALLVCVAVLCARPLRADESAAPPNPARRKLLLDRFYHEVNRVPPKGRRMILGFLFEWKNFTGAEKQERPMSARFEKMIDKYGNVNKEVLGDVLKEQLDAEARSAKTMWSPDHHTWCPMLVKASDPDDACSSVVDAELCQRLRDVIVPGSWGSYLSGTESRGLVQFVTCLLHRMKHENGFADDLSLRLLKPPDIDWPLEHVLQFYTSFIFWIAVPALVIVMLRDGASWSETAWTLFVKSYPWRTTYLCAVVAVSIPFLVAFIDYMKRTYEPILSLFPSQPDYTRTSLYGSMMIFPVGLVFVRILWNYVTFQAASELFRRFRRGSETANGHLYGALLCGAFVWWYSLSLPGAVFFTYLQCCKTGAGVRRQWRPYVTGAIAVRGVFSDGPIIFGILLPAAYWYMLDEEPELFDADYVGWCVASLVVLLANTPRGGMSKSELVYHVVGVVGLWLFVNTVGHDLVQAQESLRQRITAARDRKAAVAARREAEAEQRRRAAEEKAAKAERNRLAAEAKAAESERKLREARNEAALARARKAREEQEAREREKRDARAAALAREKAAAAWSAKAVEDEQQRLAAEAKAAESERKLRAAEAKAAEEKRRRELAAAEDERRRLAAEAKAALAEKKLRAAQKKAAEEIRRREAAAAAEAERERRAAAKIAEYEQRRAAEAARAHEETKGETVVEGADPVVAVFLASLDLSELLPRFVEESVDADVLPCLTAEDLAAMGVRTVSDSASPPRHRRDEFSFPRRGPRARSWRASSARSSARRSSSRRTTSMTPRCTRPRSKRRWRTIGRRCGPARKSDFTRVRLTG